MAADTLILTNGTSGTLVIPDLGIELSAGGTLDLLQSSEDEQLLESTDLSAALSTSGVTLVLNSAELSGPATLTYQDVIDYLEKISFFFPLDYAYISSRDGNTTATGAEIERLRNGGDVSTSTVLHTHDTAYYTKTQLSTSGQATVNWANISGAPSFGSFQWKDPVDRTDASYGSGSMLPTTGNSIDDARMVTADSNGAAALFICTATSGAWNVQWQKIADVDWGTATYIAVTPSGNLTSTNVQSALVQLQGEVDNIVNGTTPIDVSLNEAYGNGSIVTVNGANVNWELSNGKSFIVSDTGGSNTIFSVAGGTTGGTFSFNGTGSSSINTTAASLTISTTTSGNINITSSGTLNFKDQYLTAGIPLSETGNTGLGSYFTGHATSIVGAINYLSGNLSAGLSTVNGQLYVYDSTRSKNLSAANIEYVFADSSAKGTYLSVGMAQATTIGYKMPTNATIVGITAIAGTAADGQQIEIRKNDTTPALATFTFTSQAYSSWTTNVDLSAGDVLQTFATWASGEPIKNVVVSIIIRWRTP
jgi:hypothetical protein